MKLSSLMFVFPSRMHYHDQVQAVTKNHYTR
jgi:hypothetical protein